MGADTKANTWGGGSLEAGDPRLVEDGSKRNGAFVFVSDVIRTKTVSKGGRMRNGERVDTKSNTLGVPAHLSEVTALPLSASHNLVMPKVV